MSQTPVRKDTSMALLTLIMERPLDPGYAAAAQRRTASGAPTSRTGRSAQTIVVLMLIGLLLATAAVQARGQTTTRVAEREQLVAQIGRQDAAAAQLQRSIADLQARIEAERSRSLELQDQGQLADEVRRLGLLTGAIAVTGPGVTVTVDDAATVAQAPGNDPRADATADDGRVLDRDLQLVVNGLWAAGAEAVSINGQRLTALSAIRSAGQAILVDYRPLSPPYRILAVGDPKRLPASFGDGPGGRSLLYLADNFGIRHSVVANSRLVLPASAGLDVRRAEPLRAPASASSSGNTPAPQPSAPPPSEQP